MTSGARLLLIIVVGGVLLAAGTVATTAAAIYSAGTIGVDVRERSGNAVTVRVPAGVANVALALVPDRVIEELWREAAHDEELEPWLPAVREAWGEIDSARDFVLVEVSERNHHVRVEKKGRHLMVHVDSDGDTVSVTIPVSTIRRVIHKL